MNDFGFFEDPGPKPKRESAPKVKPTPEQEAALRNQLAKLERWERTNPVYQEMLAAAEERVAQARRGG